MNKMKAVGMASALFALVCFGIVGAQTATVTATLATPPGPTCVLSVEQTTIDLSSGSATINVANTGTSGWSNGQNNVPSSMPVYVSGSDWYVYNNNQWGAEAFPVGTTTWYSNQYQSQWYALTGNPDGAYSALLSGGSYSDSPIFFAAVAPGAATAGTTYGQVITISGSC